MSSQNGLLCDCGKTLPHSRTDSYMHPVKPAQNDSQELPAPTPPNRAEILAAAELAGKTYGDSQELEDKLHDVFIGQYGETLGKGNIPQLEIDILSLIAARDAALRDRLLAMIDSRGWSSAERENLKQAINAEFGVVE